MFIYLFYFLVVFIILFSSSILAMEKDKEKTLSEDTVNEITKLLEDNLKDKYNIKKVELTFLDGDTGEEIQ